MEGSCNVLEIRVCCAVLKAVSLIGNIGRNTRREILQAQGGSMQSFANNWYIRSRDEILTQVVVGKLEIWCVCAVIPFLWTPAYTLRCFWTFQPGLVFGHTA